MAFTFFAFGEVFRTGTHKAIIFDYLVKNNLESEMNSFYGYTRSWSKIGSAVSIIFAVSISFYFKNYRTVFLFSIIPYLIGIINFLGYPESSKRRLDKKANEHLKESFKELVSNKQLFKYFINDSFFEGLFKTLKDYIQPIIKYSALSLSIMYVSNEFKSKTLIIGLVYIIIHLTSAYGSRMSSKINEYIKKYKLNHIKLFFSIALFFFITLFFTIKYNFIAVTIVIFILYNIMENIWRPFMISNITKNISKDKTATILSIDNQGQTIIKLIFAPVFGYIADINISYTMLLASILVFVILIFNSFFGNNKHLSK